MNPSSTALRSLLDRDLEHGERDAIAIELAELDRRVTSLPEGAWFDHEKLATARLCASGSLHGVSGGSTPDVEQARARRGWADANALVVRYVGEGAELDLTRVRLVHASLVCRSEPSPLRVRSVRIGPAAAPAAEDVDALLAPMFERVLARAGRVHPIAGAALLYQWLVSTHPFDDANGRTSRLVADWLLARHGFPPMSFRDPVAAFVTVFPEDDPPIPVAETIRVVAGAVARSLAFVRLPTACSP